MINVYDFDKTIYDGDSTIDFYLYCLNRNKTLIFMLPTQLYGMLLYILKVKEKEYFKEKFFSFIKKINVEEYVVDFWKKNNKKIKNWYLENKQTTDVIISASPEFLLKGLEKELKIGRIIASVVDPKTGKFTSKNCYGKEKVKRFKTEYKNTKIKDFYSDSLSDLPMMELAKNGYIVKGNTIVNYKEYQDK